MSKYGFFSGPYFPVFVLNTGKYGPEKTSYLDTFHAVRQKKRKFEKSKEDDGDRSNQAQLKESTEDAEEMEM